MVSKEFECGTCGERFERTMSIHSVEDPACPFCGGNTDQVFDHGNVSGWFKQTPGKLTGVYDYDYGKKATWDLTAPGKMEMLKKEGRIRDPFVDR
jgi:putative FmdB family regulatory protein